MLTVNESADKDDLIRLWDEAESEVNRRGSGYVSDPSSMRCDPFRVYGPLYYVGDKVVCVHLLDTGDGLVLFDSGFPHAASQLLGNIAALGFDPRDIRYVIHGHEHFDHFGATRMLQVRYGCRTFIHEAGAETFRINPHHTEIQASRSPDAALFVPDVEFSDGDVIRLGDARIECAHTPGHSAGAASFFFDAAHEGRTLRVGLCGLNGCFTLYPGRLLKYGIPLSAGDDYLASIEKLRDFAVDITLDTHPRPRGAMDKRDAMLAAPGSNPFIDPGFWGRNLDDYEARYLDFMAGIEKRLSG